MVTLLRPHRHADGPAAFRLHRTQQPLLQACSLRSMAQDPSHPHRSKGTQQQPEQERHRDQEPSTSTSSSSAGGGSEAGSWLQLGLGPASPSSSRRKRRRTDEGPSMTPVPPPPPAGLGSPPPRPPPQLSLFPAGPSSPMTVVVSPPPPAHEAGMWFVLRAAQNQRREPPLPQIPRSFLRVRDGMMTVRLVMRYLVNKLGLQEESQVEITCRGQRLLPPMTLQHVRNTIWRPSPVEAAAVSPAPGPASSNQLMTLHYGRS